MEKILHLAVELRLWRDYFFLFTRALNRLSITNRTTSTAAKIRYRAPLIRASVTNSSLFLLDTPSCKQTRRGSGDDSPRESSTIAGDE